MLKDTQLYDGKSEKKEKRKPYHQAGIEPTTF